MIDVGPDVAVIVINYGSHELVAENLSRTLAGTQARGVVVDSYVDQAERAQIRRICAANSWELLTPSRNVGFGGGVNLAAAHALGRGATCLVLLNPDAYLNPGSLNLLVEAVRGDESALVAPAVLRPDGQPYAVGTVDLSLADGTMTATSHRPPGRPVEAVMPWLSGAVLALSADLWSRSGGFDERYFLYWEDVDFSRRVGDCGGRLVAHPDATAVHDEGGTHGSAPTDRRRAVGGKSSTYYYYNVRNRLLFGALYLDDSGWRRWVQLSGVSAYHLLLQGGRRQFLYGPGPVLTALRATWDGWRLGRSVRAQRSRAPGPPGATRSG